MKVAELVAFCSTRVADGTSQAQDPEIRMTKDESETATHTTQPLTRGSRMKIQSNPFFKYAVKSCLSCWFLPRDGPIL